MSSTEKFISDQSHNPEIARFDKTKIGVAVDFMRNEPFFSKIPGLADSNADAVVNGVLEDLSDLRFVNCIEQCAHGCIHCSEFAGSHPSYIPFQDFRYEIDTLSKLKSISGLNFSYKTYDVTTHQDGDTMMYRGYAGYPIGKPQFSSYDVLKYFRESKLFDSETPGRNRFQLFTTGWFDYGSSTLVSDGAKKIVEDATTIFGNDPKTDEPGRMVFSFGTYPRYFHMGDKQMEWWQAKLVNMFQIIKPLLDQSRLQFSIKYVNRDLIGDMSTDMYSAQFQTALLTDLLYKAGYPNLDTIMQDDNVVRVRPAYKAGRANSLSLPFISAQDYLKEYYPPEYSAVRQNTQWENTLSIKGELKRRPVKTDQYNEDAQEPATIAGDLIHTFWLPTYG